MTDSQLSLRHETSRNLKNKEKEKLTKTGKRDHQELLNSWWSRLPVLVNFSKVVFYFTTMTYLKKIVYEHN